MNCTSTSTSMLIELRRNLSKTTHFLLSDRDKFSIREIHYLRSQKNSLHCAKTFTANVSHFRKYHAIIQPSSNVLSCSFLVLSNMSNSDNEGPVTRSVKRRHNLIEGELSLKQSEKALKPSESTLFETAESEEILSKINNMNFDETSSTVGRQNQTPSELEDMLLRDSPSKSDKPTLRSSTPTKNSDINNNAFVFSPSNSFIRTSEWVDAHTIPSFNVNTAPNSASETSFSSTTRNGNTFFLPSLLKIHLLDLLMILDNLKRIIPFNTMASSQQSNFKFSIVPVEYPAKLIGEAEKKIIGDTLASNREVANEQGNTENDPNKVIRFTKFDIKHGHLQISCLNFRTTTWLQLTVEATCWSDEGLAMKIKCVPTINANPRPTFSILSPLETSFDQLKDEVRRSNVPSADWILVHSGPLKSAPIRGLPGKVIGYRTIFLSNNELKEAVLKEPKREMLILHPMMSKYMTIRYIQNEMDSQGEKNQIFLLSQEFLLMCLSFKLLINPMIGTNPNYKQSKDVRRRLLQTSSQSWLSWTMTAWNKTSNKETNLSNLTIQSSCQKSEVRVYEFYSILSGNTQTSLRGNTLYDLNLKKNPPEIAKRKFSSAKNIEIRNLCAIPRNHYTNKNILKKEKFESKLSNKKFEPYLHFLFMKWSICFFLIFLNRFASHLDLLRKHLHEKLSKALDDPGTSDTSHKQTSHTPTNSDKLRRIAVQKKRKLYTFKNTRPLKTTKDILKRSSHSVINNDKILSNKNFMFSLKGTILPGKCLRIKIYAISAKKYTITFIND